MRNAALIIATALTLSFLTTPLCFGQAWPAPKGEGAVTASCQGVVADGHYLDDGTKAPGYRTQAVNVVVETVYGITDRLTVDVLVPWVNVKYLGPEEPLNLPDNVLDDGTYHGAVSDLRFELRYNAFSRYGVVTPFFAALIPSHSYDTLGEAAPGRDFQEYYFGAYAGRLLDPFLPRAFVQGMYSYAIVRQDLDIPLNHSDFGLEVGYFVTDSVPITFVWNALWTHGGLTFEELFMAPPEVFRNLDRVVASQFHHLGVSGSFPLSPTVSANVEFTKFVAGVDAHYGYSISAGVSWVFKSQPVEMMPIKGRTQAEGNSPARSYLAHRALRGGREAAGARLRGGH